MLTRQIVLIACVAFIQSTAAAGEDDAREQARALLKQGNDKLDQGLYVDALELFERANRLFPSPKLHFNIAQTLNELGRPLDALEHYEQFVREVQQGDSPELWRTAHQQIFRLQGLIARVEIQCNVLDAQVTVDGKPVGTTPLAAAFRLLPGAHAIIVAKPGYEQRVIERTFRAGESATERIELRTEEDAAATRRAVLRAEAERRASEERLRQAEAETSRRRDRSRRTLRIAGFTTLGIGVASLAAAGVLGLLELNAVSRVNSQAEGTPWRSASDDYALSSALRAGAIATLAAGAALAVTAAILIPLSRPGAKERRLTLGPVLAPGHGGLTFGGAF